MEICLSDLCCRRALTGRLHMLKFKTRRVSRAVSGDAVKYSGVVENEGVVDFDAVINEVAAKKRIRPADLRYHVETFLESVREMMLEDGRARRIGDYLLLQLQVRGSFDQADEDFVPGRNELLVEGRSMKRFRNLEKSVEISNVNPRTRGKAEYAMTPGDAGKPAAPGADVAENV